MTDWAHRWGSSREDRCEAGHDHHDRLRVGIELSPVRRAVPDCPAPPTSLRFGFTVFHAGRYTGTPCYCTADDELSRSVAEQGTWEPWQTAVALDILDAHPERAVIDLGSHVGWYSTLALATGHRVYALDADAEHVALARTNAAEVFGDDRLEVAVGWLDADSVPLRPDDVGRVRLAKVDVEGSEGLAAAALAPLLWERYVDYALVELSPEFGLGWWDAIGIFTGFGYSAHVLPDKGDDVEEFERAPLAVTLARSGPPVELDAQATVLFAAP